MVGRVLGNKETLRSSSDIGSLPAVGSACRRNPPTGGDWIDVRLSAT